MGTALFIFAGLMVTAAYHSQLVDAICPRTAGEAEIRAKDCLKSVGLSMEPSPGAADDSADGAKGGTSGDADRLKQYCQDGTLDQAIVCVENILVECNAQNPQVGDLLSKSVSIEKLRNGFRYMCENIDILSIQAKCIEEQTTPISECVRLETAEFHKRINAQKENGRPQSHDVWAMSCRFMDKVFVCQDKFYRKNCGEEVANVLANFMQSVKPPVCANYGNGSSGQTVAPISVLAGLVMFCLLSVL